MILEIIITTMNRNIFQLLSRLPVSRSDVIYQISHQITDNISNPYINEVTKIINKREDLTYFYYFEKGLSRNRNRSISKSTGDICLVADDDIEFRPDFSDTIFKAFQNIPKADIITFKTEFPDGKPYKSYWSCMKKHNLRTAMRVSSFEIAYRNSSIKNNNLLWDERFGLGGDPYTNHMENIFIVDALKRGLQVFFIPETIVTHPFENSGFIYSDHLIFSKGAAFYRMFGGISYILNVLYAVKKYKEICDFTSFWKFIKISFQGSSHYRLYYSRILTSSNS